MNLKREMTWKRLEEIAAKKASASNEAVLVSPRKAIGKPSGQQVRKIPYNGFDIQIITQTID